MRKTFTEWLIYLRENPRPKKEICKKCNKPCEKNYNLSGFDGMCRNCKIELMVLISSG